MNVARIVLKEFKLNIRNFKANSMMVLFPIVLIIILGAAFSGQFSSTIRLGSVKVLYTEDKGGSNHYLSDAFRSFRESVTEEYGLIFEKTEDAEAAIERIKGNEFTGYIYVSDESREIKLYKNELHGGYQAVIVESALSSFIETYRAMETIALNNPAALAALSTEKQGDYVELKSLSQKKQPGSLDYYAVTMMTMILLYASMTGFWSVREDIEQMTANRTLSAPLKKYEFLTGKVLGCIMVTLVQGIVVVLFSKFILKAYWGEDVTGVILLLATYSIMSVSLGVGMAYLFKNGDAASGILNTVIPILVFLGGGYVPLAVMGGSMDGISNISPVKWANSALFNLIYDGGYSQLAISVTVNLAVAAVFIMISAVFSRKGTGKYA